MQICQITSVVTKLAPKSLSDHELVVAISTRDQRAMEELFDRHESRVYRFALRTFKQQELAEDVAAETFCEVWRGAASAFKGQAKVSTWLTAIARNIGMTMLRRRSEQALDETAALSMEDAADNPEDTAAKKQRDAIVARCIDSLSPNHRELIRFFYFQDKSIVELAELTGVPVNTVKTRLFHARNVMGRLLKSYEIERYDSLGDAGGVAWPMNWSGCFGKTSSNLEEAYA